MALDASQARCRVCGVVFHAGWAAKLRLKGYPVGDDPQRMICGRKECMEADPDNPSRA